MVVKPTNDLVQTSHADVKDVAHQVVVDGRFIDEFAANPNTVVHYLGIPVAKETKAKLTTHTGKTDLTSMLGHKVSAAPEAVGVVLVVVVAIVILVVATPVGGKEDVARSISDPFEEDKV